MPDSPHLLLSHLLLSCTLCATLSACGGSQSSSSDTNSDANAAAGSNPAAQVQPVLIQSEEVDPIAFPFGQHGNSNNQSNALNPVNTEQPAGPGNEQTDDQTTEDPPPVVTTTETTNTTNPASDRTVTRESLAALNLPIDGSTIGDYQLVNAYPALSFSEALLVAAVPDEDRLVVVEQAGRIKVFDDHAAVAESDVVLDITASVAFSGEQGLLGLAFDPDFASNRYVYINYTAQGTNQTVVSRWVWSTEEDQLDPGSEHIVLSVPQPYHSHNGGMIAFGPDNYLYIALGDGGDGGDPHNNAQDRSTLLGSLLRIDVHPADPTAGYAIPADNPFVGEAGVREEIFAYGFRNPFRFSFDRATGDIWLGDVGQEHREEVNVVTAGGNYGWRVFEGTRTNERSLNTLPDSAFSVPVHEYGHASGLSVIGGYVYRGERVSSLTGRYLLADFYSGVITALNWDGNRVTSQTALASVDGPTSFGEAHDGDVLVVSRYKGIYRFEERIQSTPFPEKLSETGLFHDVQSLTPVSGLIEYRTAHPFWSDGATKQRWIGVPEYKHITFRDDDWWFPIGSVSVKHFVMNMIDGEPLSTRRLETRVLYNTRQGWQGFSYRWNEQQSEAFLVRNQETENLYITQADGSIRVQKYEYPGGRDCLVCHNDASTFLLGPETRQMNIDYPYAAGEQNQIQALNQQGLFEQDTEYETALPALPSMSDMDATLDNRARAYLDVNCGHCHQPGGPAATDLDLRFETASNATGAIDRAPQKGYLGVSDARIISPGSKEESILWLRMNTLDDERMPPMASHRIDEAGVDLIGQWIDSL